MTPSPKNRLPRFSLRTMFVAVTVVGLGAALLASVFHAYRKEWNRMRCGRNLQQIDFALHNYSDVYGSLPPAYLADESGVPLHSWRVLILPFLERDDIYRQIRLDEPWNSPHNIRLASQVPHVYQCPIDSPANEGDTSYVAVIGPETMWQGANGKLLPVNGQTLATTIIVIEVPNSGISWMEPRDLPFEAATSIGKQSQGGIGCLHRCAGKEDPVKGVYSRSDSSGRLRGTNCLFADGTIRTVSEAVSTNTMSELLKVNGKPTLIHNQNVTGTTTVQAK